MIDRQSTIVVFSFFAYLFRRYGREKRWRVTGIGVIKTKDEKKECHWEGRRGRERAIYYYDCDVCLSLFRVVINELRYVIMLM